MNKCPDNTICINNLHIIYISLILLVSMYFFTNNYINNIYKNNNFESIKQLEENLFRRINDTQEVKTIQKQVNLDNVKEIEPPPNHNVNMDIDVLTNPLVPPLKRNYHLGHQSIGRMPINIETRESSGDYQQIGVLHKTSNTNNGFDNPGNNDKSVILQLFGKPLYKGSSNWNYYIIDKNNFKIPLNINNRNCSDNQQGCSEINNNDEINIEQYNGDFKVQILKFNAPKYLPYIY